VPPTQPADSSGYHVGDTSFTPTSRADALRITHQTHTFAAQLRYAAWTMIPVGIVNGAISGLVMPFLLPAYAPEDLAVFSVSLGSLGTLVGMCLVGDLAL
jgi:hypothetical protein